MFSLISGDTKKSTITTHGDNSRELISTFKGTANGKDITITTNGEFSSALAINEQGSGVCLGCTLTTNGKNSPLFDSKGNDGGGLVIQKTTGLAMKSKIAIIEGTTSVSITDECEMKCGANPSKDNNNFDQGGIMLYQSGSRLISGNSFNCEDSTFEIFKNESIL